jgi:uncharacterized lipoprotein YajG
MFNTSKILFVELYLDYDCKKEKRKLIVLKMKYLYLIIQILLLSGCVAGQEIALHYDPEAAVSTSQAAGKEVSVQVIDERPYITNMDKDPSYIGHYRAGYGNTWDVTNLNEMPLADQVAMDVNNELKALGYTVAGQGVRKSVLVTIQDFNFDSMNNGKLWYKANVKVFDNRKLIANSEAKDNVIIDGSFWVGGKYEMEKEVPVYYGHMIRGLIRANPETMGALQ